MNMKFGLSDTDIESMQKVFDNEPNVETVVIFGSRAKGNYKRGSDIDFAVKGSDYTYDDNLELMGKLDDLNLPYMIDLIDYDSIEDKNLMEHIDRAGIVFYKRIKKYK